jgi:hypothetical protein
VVTQAAASRRDRKHSVLLSKTGVASDVKPGRSIANCHPGDCEPLINRSKERMRSTIIDLKGQFCLTIALVALVAIVESPTPIPAQSPTQVSPSESPAASTNKGAKRDGANAIENTGEAKNRESGMNARSSPNRTKDSIKTKTRHDKGTAQEHEPRPTATRSPSKNDENAISRKLKQTSQEPEPRPIATATPKKKSQRDD